MAACGVCGKENPYGSSFCPFCGKLMPGAVPRTGTQLQQAAVPSVPPVAPAPQAAPPPPVVQQAPVVQQPPVVQAPAVQPPVVQQAHAAQQGASHLAAAVAREHAGVRATVTDTPPERPAMGAGVVIGVQRTVSSVFMGSGAAAQAAPRVAAAPSAKPSACPTCAAPLGPTTKFCSQCGTRVDPNAPAPPADRAAAAIKQTQFLQAVKVQEELKNKNRLIIMDADGREQMQYSIAASQTMCGRVHGMMILDDETVSPAHCVFRFLDGVLSVEDAGSLNGVFIKLRGDVALGPGDAFRAGRHLLRVEAADALSLPPPARADDDDSRISGSPRGTPATLRIVEVLEGGALGDSRLVRGNSMTFGRTGCDFTLGDASASSRHCELSIQAGLPLLRDLGSTNGTFIRLREEQRLENGDVLLIGNQRVRVDVKS